MCCWLVLDVIQFVWLGFVCEVGYIIQFKKKVVEYLGLFFFFCDWSFFYNKQKCEVFFFEIIYQGEFKEKFCGEFIDNQDKENQVCQSVKEIIQVLDLKN